MNKFFLIVAAFLCVILAGFTNKDHIIIRQSPFPVKKTIDVIEAFFKQHGVTIYARIDQQAEAAKSGQSLQPLEFLLFGNPQKGASLMAADPEVALDLPLKLIAWEDAQHKVFVAYNDAAYITARYGLDAKFTPLIDIDPVITKLLREGK